MQIDYARIQRQTGYQDILEALAAYKERQEPNAAWYCIEIIRPMVHGVVSNYIRYSQKIGLASMVTREDLTQEAFSHLIKALKGFEPPDYAEADPDVCAKCWNRYANLLIKSPIRERYAASLNQVDIPNWAIKLSRRINLAIADMEVDHFNSGGKSDGLAHRPDPLEIARRAQLPYSKVKRFLDHGFDMLPQQRFAYTGPAINTGIGHRYETDLRDTSNYGLDPAIRFENDEAEMLSMVWQLLDKPQQEVVSARFGLNAEPMTLRATAEAMGLSIKQVRLIEAKALIRLRESLAAMDE